MSEQAFTEDELIVIRKALGRYDAESDAESNLANTAWDKANEAIIDAGKDE